MNDTYFIEVQEITGRDCTEPHFYVNKPFDNLDDIKQFAEDLIKHNLNVYREEPMRIYKCHNNRLFLILTKAAHLKEWQPFEYVKPESGDLTAET